MNKSSQPSALLRGKEFEQRVKDDWEKSAIGTMDMERPIDLSLLPHRGSRIRKGRIDILVSELGEFESVIEIKATDWDRIRPANITKNLGSHRRQIWKYTYEHTDVKKVDVCAGMIYPRVPKRKG